MVHQLLDGNIAVDDHKKEEKGKPNEPVSMCESHSKYEKGTDAD